MSTDPEFDAPPPCTDCPPVANCPCRRCHGLRWVQVQPAYAQRQVPDPNPEALATLSATQQAVLLHRLAGQRAAAAESYYPCRDCNPAAFFRWAGGHWGPDHDPGTCTDCIAVYGKRAARKVAAYSDTARKDL